MTETSCSRQRKFTPENFFVSILHLVSGANKEGYLHALARTWRKCGLELDDTPAKSSLSEFRKKVSFQFFEEIYRKDLTKIDAQRKKLRGFYVYAADGDHLDIAPSAPLLESGYRGYPTKHNRRETHYLKIYTAQVYDVINGLVKDFRYAPVQSETEMARQMVPALEKNSITIYDRLHAGYPTIEAHLEARSFFLVRARSGGDGHNVQREIRRFRDSKKKSAWITWKPQGYLWLKPAVQVRLVKIRHPATREIIIFATNLREDQFTDQEIAELYLRRWDIEGSFRDLTATLKLEQWHSKDLNGVLQEIYALFWLANKVKFACFAITSKAKNWLLSWSYRKCNFKLCANVFMDNIDLLVQRRSRAFGKILQHWMERTTENRRRLSRKYPRVVKKRGIDYAMANVVPKRP